MAAGAHSVPLSSGVNISKVRSNLRRSVVPQAKNEPVDLGQTKPFYRKKLYFSGKNFYNTLQSYTFGKPVNRTVQLAEDRGEKEPRKLFQRAIGFAKGWKLWEALGVPSPSGTVVRLY